MLSREVSGNASNSLLDVVNRFLRLVGLELEDDHFLRKLAHFCEFGLLGLELSLLAVVRQKKQRALVKCLVFCLFVALVDEGIQYFSGRACRFSDVMLDFFGASFGVLGLDMVLSIISSRVRRNKNMEKSAF